jgi:hypothetical protein
MPLTFNDQAGRFVNERGQFVAESTVRRVVNGIADAASERLAQASLRLLDGELSLAAWQAEAMRTIKLSQVATATIAHGGAARMGPAQYGAAGREIRTQYDYLRTFAEQVASGEQPLNGSLTARARQYGQAARVTFEREYRRDQQRRGYQSERNVLARAEHCAECREQTARGWVPVGSLVPVGQRTCRANCRCSLRYARDAAQAA